MNKLLVFLVLAFLLLGCNSVQTQPNLQTQQNNIVNQPEETGTIFESGVRLTAAGIDADELTLKKGESLTVYIADDDVDGHYLTMAGSRLSEKQLHKGEKVDVPFQDKGTFEIIDETSDYTLIVHVK